MSFIYKPTTLEPTNSTIFTTKLIPNSSAALNNSMTRQQTTSDHSKALSSPKLCNPPVAGIKLRALCLPGRCAAELHLSPKLCNLKLIQHTDLVLPIVSRGITNKDWTDHIAPSGLLTHIGASPCGPAYDR